MMEDALDLALSRAFRSLLFCSLLRLARFFRQPRGRKKVVSLPPRRSNCAKRLRRGERGRESGGKYRCFFSLFCRPLSLCLLFDFCRASRRVTSRPRLLLDARALLPALPAGGENATYCSCWRRRITEIRGGRGANERKRERKKRTRCDWHQLQSAGVRPVQRERREGSEALPSTPFFLRLPLTLTFRLLLLVLLKTKNRSSSRKPSTRPTWRTTRPRAR
jgi:hypothetical protein